MSKRKAGPAPPTFRKAVVEAAQQVNVPVDDFERATILGQLAALLTNHPRMRTGIAYKGGAIMRLVDNSPRLSRDLDGAAVSGTAIRRSWVEDALSTAEARKIILGLPKIVNENRTSLVFPIIECRPLSGRAKITVSLSINWDEPLLESPELCEIRLPKGVARIPVVHRRERAAEKVRAFMMRAEVADAYDLYRYGSHILQAEDWSRLPGLISSKLKGRFPKETDLHNQFDLVLTQVERSWGRRGTMVIAAAEIPDWLTVLKELKRFEASVPRVV